jgi:hypothetical protein
LPFHEPVFPEYSLVFDNCTYIPLPEGQTDIPSALANMYMLNDFSKPLMDFDDLPVMQSALHPLPSKKENERSDECPAVLCPGLISPQQTRKKNKQK